MRLTKLSYPVSLLFTPQRKYEAKTLVLMVDVCLCRKRSPEAGYSLFIALYEIVWSTLCTANEWGMLKGLIFNSYPVCYNSVSFNDNAWSVHAVKISFLYIVFNHQILWIVPPLGCVMTNFKWLSFKILLQWCIRASMWKH